MKNTQLSLVDIEKSAFNRSNLKSTIENLEKYESIKPELSMLKQTYYQIFGFLTVLEANKKAEEMLVRFIEDYRKRKAYPLSYKGFNSWSKTKERTNLMGPEWEKERKLLRRFKREINGVFAAYTLLYRMSNEIRENK
tara:strand:- start:2231 stop:2644 length:414 start_codon:yes stop_codon:yes gene_type:complete